MKALVVFLGTLVIAGIVAFLYLGLGGGSTFNASGLKTEAKLGNYTVPAIAPSTVKRKMDAHEKFVLLDVRTPEENREEHIPGALLLPLAEPGIFGAQVEKLIPDKNTEVVLHCRSGIRSDEAAKIMNRLGYRHIYNMGGILDWPYNKEGTGEGTKKG